MRFKPFLVLLLLTVSCGTARQIRSVTDAVWAYGESHPEGFTLDVRTMDNPREGIAVSYLDGSENPTKKEVRAMVKHALKHDGYVGGWADRQTGTYDFDSVKLFPEDSLSTALSFAAANHQKAVFVLSSGKEVRLRDSDEEFTPNTLIIMCDEATGKEPLRKAIKEYGAEIIYDYTIINGMAIRIRDGVKIEEAIEYFKKVKGVVSVNRDRINHLVEPVKPRLETM